MQTEFIASHCICCHSTRLTKSQAVLMPFIAKRTFGHEPLEIPAEWGMRNLKTGMAYTLCNSLQCVDCGALFLDYRFTDAQMLALYRGYMGKDYVAERNRYEPGFARDIAPHISGRHAFVDAVEAWLAPRVPPRPRLLDWGGGSGINTPLLASSSLAHIHDISGNELVAPARRVDADDMRRQHYDLVLCRHVLEHVPFPFELIMQMLPALSTDTLLYMEVPHEPVVSRNPHSRELAPLKRVWHEHINYFGIKSMTCLLERIGLDIIDQHVLSTDLGYRKEEVIGFLARKRAAS